MAARVRSERDSIATHLADLMRGQHRASGISIVKVAAPTDRVGDDEDGRLKAVPLEQGPRVLIVVHVPIVESDRERASRQAGCLRAAEDGFERGQRHCAVAVITQPAKLALKARNADKVAVWVVLWWLGHHAVIKEHRQPRGCSRIDHGHAHASASISWLCRNGSSTP